MSEIIFLAILALIVIGPKELPEVARTLGRFLNELKRTTGDFTEDLKKQARVDRIDLFEPMTKPTPRSPPSKPEVVTNDEDGDWTSPDHVPHGGAPTMHDSVHKREPVQMDLTEQKGTDDSDDNKGNKA